MHNLYALDPVPEGAPHTRVELRRRAVSWRCSILFGDVTPEQRGAVCLLPEGYQAPNPNLQAGLRGRQLWNFGLMILCSFSSGAAW